MLSVNENKSYVDAISEMRSDLMKNRVDILKIKEIYTVDKSRYSDAIIKLSKAISDIYALQRKNYRLNQELYYIKIIIVLHIVWDLINVLL